MRRTKKKRNRKESKCKRVTINCSKNLNQKGRNSNKNNKKQPTKSRRK